MRGQQPIREEINSLWEAIRGADVSLDTLRDKLELADRRSAVDRWLLAIAYAGLFLLAGYVA